MKKKILFLALASLMLISNHNEDLSLNASDKLTFKNEETINYSNSSVLLCIQQLRTRQGGKTNYW